MSPSKFPQLSDEDLLGHYHRTRNFKAFRQLYLRHKDALYRYCVQINSVATHPLAQRLWQDLLERPPELCGRLFRNWLYIRVNKMLGQEKVEHVEPPAGGNRLLEAIQHLPRLEKNLFLLHNECGLSLATAADIEKISLSECTEHYRSAKAMMEEFLFGAKGRPWPVREVAV
ncbi:RNA polymerase sigma factor [Microbulbifer sp. 2201CG32-9]|uniref:RNA polymerase sigma factor n=1 Tax=Microbulbifer sp. 2201CG32-9 TaxID=3232309 RepID=UPI00345C2E0F